MSAAHKSGENSMATAHTPGPWGLFEVGEGRLVKQCPVSPDRTSILTLVEEDGTTFAAVLKDEDARLIAAAPELLSAACYAAQCLRDEALCQSERDEVLRELNAAIAKAITGEPA